MSLKHSPEGAIGVFDSGFGGLTILRDISAALPHYDYIYLGDNARAPYGTRSFESVYAYTREAVERLFELGVPLVILACNTASAKALRTIQQRDLPIWGDNRRVLGVIRPTIERLPEISRNGHIGILATRGTVVSESYPIEIAKLHGAEFKVTQVPSSLLVSLVENNEIESEGTLFFVRKYIEDLFRADPLIDTVVLGCTHFPLLRGVIERVLPAGVTLVEQGSLVASSLADYLRRHPEMESRLSKGGTVRYLTTEQKSHFESLAKIFTGSHIVAEHIDAH